MAEAVPEEAFAHPGGAGDDDAGAPAPNCRRRRAPDSRDCARDVNSICSKQQPDNGPGTLQQPRQPAVVALIPLRIDQLPKFTAVYLAPSRTPRPAAASPARAGASLRLSKPVAGASGVQGGPWVFLEAIGMPAHLVANPTGPQWAARRPTRTPNSVVHHLHPDAGRCSILAKDCPRAAGAARWPLLADSRARTAPSSAPTRAGVGSIAKDAVSDARTPGSCSGRCRRFR